MLHSKKEANTRVPTTAGKQKTNLRHPLDKVERHPAGFLPAPCHRRAELYLQELNLNEAIRVLQLKLPVAL